ncbi:MAG TPA: PEGA domain-containing protein [Ignavibacteria bacterium]|nr:PEGA domain-containing protein [Ignavibacteria bacterium]
MKKFIIILILIYTNLFSQSDTGVYNVSFTSNFDSSLVYIDSVFIGYTPLNNYELERGNYFIEIKRGIDNRDWDIQEKEYLLDLVCDTVLSANFKFYYFINSSPANSLVFYDNIILGETPLRYFTENKLFGYLILKKENYEDFKLELQENKFELFGVLENKNSKILSEEIIYNKKTSFKSPRNYTVIGLLSAALISTGYSAYRTKTVSNQLYDNYNLTGNQHDLDRSNQQNIFFYISLGLMQAALGGLIYFLFIK